MYIYIVALLVKNTENISELKKKKKNILTATKEKKNILTATKERLTAIKEMQEGKEIKEILTIRSLAYH